MKKLLFLGLCIFGLYFVSTKSQKKNIFLKNKPLFGTFGKKTLDLITLHHINLYDDYLLIWLIDVITSKKTEDTKEKILSVSQLKPKIESIYMISCFYLSFSDPKECESITRTATEIFPNNWRMLLIQGYIFAFLLQDKQKASYFYEMASKKNTAPSYLYSLSKRLQNGTEFKPKEFLKIPGMESLHIFEQSE